MSNSTSYATVNPANVAQTDTKRASGHDVSTQLCETLRTIEERISSRRSAGETIYAFVDQINDDLMADRTSIDSLEDAVRSLRDHYLAVRAARLRAYVGLDNTRSSTERLSHASATLVGQYQNEKALRDFLTRPRFAAVFTAHPTFALNDDVYRHLVERASEPTHPIPQFATHRRDAPPTLDEEQALALSAIQRGRDALDCLGRALLTEIHAKWPGITILPSLIVLSTWVGFDTDGRSDISWWDTIRIRLSLKREQFLRLSSQLHEFLSPQSPLMLRIARAIDAVEAQERACPRNADHQASDVAAFASVLIAHREAALLDCRELDHLFADAAEDVRDEHRLAYRIAHAGFNTHGLSLAHIHTRLNSTQIHNAVRRQLDIRHDPAIPSRRRRALVQIDEALKSLHHPVNVDFGSLILEQASAGRLMMTMAQILKHIDQATSIRFLIAETESGYTLLATLWLARYYGIADQQIEISPLFETPDALEQGEVILEEAFRSSYWRDYLRKNGKLCLQFGYSDSGRYIGQLAATNLVERLRLRTLAILQQYGMEDIELVLFDTHGESIGRGAHPFSLRDRLAYFSPEHTRRLFASAGIVSREETAFQGADGYTLFGTPQLAESTLATIVEHLGVNPTSSSDDPIYKEPNFSADFFSTIAVDMKDLVEDPGYGGLLGAFGPALIDKTGSRPSARQSDGVQSRQIKHPSQLRAIPNNAILEQLGWWSNVLQGLGSAAARHPDIFDHLVQKSKRFGLALDFARKALLHSDLEVLRSIVRMLDPGTWLDRAANAHGDTLRTQYLALASGLEALGFWKNVPAMYRRIQTDHIALRAVWSHNLSMSVPERTLHALRHAMIEQIWLLATRINYFSPRNNISREDLLQLVLRLEIPTVLRLLDDIFPRSHDLVGRLDFAEPSGPRDEHGYETEHEEIFKPMARIFALVREISVAIMHANGYFG